MKVVLIRYHNEGDINTRLPESMNKIKGIRPFLGLTYIAAYLLQQKIEVKILDCLALNYDYPKTAEYLKREKPDIVGITAMTSIFKGCLTAARAAKEAGAIVVIGGPHVSILPEETLSFPYIDYALDGEGEIPMFELVKALESKKSVSNIAGLVYRENGRIKKNPPYINKDINSLPWPARHLTPFYRYSSIIGISPIASMIAGRGCPYQCSFCSKHPWDRNIRFRNYIDVVDEMEFLVKDYGVKEIMFEDDTFTLNKNFVYNLCQEIIRRKLKVFWECPTRADRVDKDMLIIMKKSGCIRLRYGVDSGDERILKLMNKKMTKEQIIKAFQWTRQAGIESFAYFIIGYPTETPQTIRNTINFAKRIDADKVMFTVATPYPGTEMYNLAIREGIIDKDYWRKFIRGEINYRIPYLVPKANYYAKKAYREFYFRPSIIWRHIRKIDSWEKVTQLFTAFKGLLTYRE